MECEAEKDENTARHCTARGCARATSLRFGICFRPSGGKSRPFPQPAPAGQGGCTGRAQFEAQARSSAFSCQSPRVARRGRRVAASASKAGEGGGGGRRKKTAHGVTGYDGSENSPGTTSTPYGISLQPASTGQAAAPFALNSRRKHIVTLSYSTIPELPPGAGVELRAHTGRRGRRRWAQKKRCTVGNFARHFSAATMDSPSQRQPTSRLQRSHSIRDASTEYHMLVPESQSCAQAQAWSHGGGRKQAGVDGDGGRKEKRCTVLRGMTQRCVAWRNSPTTAMEPPKSQRQPASQPSGCTGRAQFEAQVHSSYSSFQSP